MCSHCGRHRFRDSLKTELADEESRTTSADTPVDCNGFAPQGKSAAFDEPIAHAATMTARLVVIRGQKLDHEFPLYNGRNLIGRSDELPVDIDLTQLESPVQVWSSRKHAVIHFERGTVCIEDLNSLNGTFINRVRLHPGRRYQLKAGDVIQIGTVQFRLEIPAAAAR